MYCYNLYAATLNMQFVESNNYEVVRIDTKKKSILLWHNLCLALETETIILLFKHNGFRNINTRVRVISIEYNKIYYVLFYSTNKGSGFCYFRYT